VSSFLPTIFAPYIRVWVRTSGYLFKALLVGLEGFKREEDFGGFILPRNTKSP